uniref:PTB domain-containing adapter protein ced-6-like isoform X4 n=1 Tax=Bombus vancouverensis nearcticus TaxID=2705178 RepID=UPI00143B40BA|nr:PTB domain-containing adapter protein ced-6-like isoform X4 [Bombus vancouverensis nearcticus]
MPSSYLLLKGENRKNREKRFQKGKSELCEEWALANSRECVEGSGSAGTTHDESEDASEARFTLKYLGSTLVETPSSEEATAEAIKTVITMAKASGKKLQRVSLAVSLKGIRMTDLATEEDQLQVSIYRISYCSADAAHDHVFAFIATNLNETMECHAFLCPKRKMAQTVTLTVAQAFNTAYEAWQLSQADPRIHHAQDKSPSLTDDRNGIGLVLCPVINEAFLVQDYEMSRSYQLAISEKSVFVCEDSTCTSQRLVDTGVHVGR